MVKYVHLDKKGRLISIFVGGIDLCSSSPVRRSAWRDPMKLGTCWECLLHGVIDIANEVGRYRNILLPDVLLFLVHWSLELSFLPSLTLRAVGPLRKIETP